MLSICISTCATASTYHVQDFKDVEGDRLIGRQTLPLLRPEQARLSVLLVLLAWSVALTVIWELDLFSASTLICLGLTVGLRFFCYRTVSTDQMSFYWYNVSSYQRVRHETKTDINLRFGCLMFTLFRYTGGWSSFEHAEFSHVHFYCVLHNYWFYVIHLV